MKNYCKRCDFETNHEILFKEVVDWDYSMQYECCSVFMIVKCLGCGEISFRDEFIDFESSYMDEFGNWTPDIKITNYPPKEHVSKRLDNLCFLPDKVKLIYNEAIIAYNSECFILTGVSFRGVIEAVCLEEKIDGTDLKKKIDNLVERRLITEKEANRLHSIRFIGNDSIHEMKVPYEKSLKAVLNIIDHLLDNLYIIDYANERVLETVIDSFSKFEDLLNSCLINIEKGSEVSLIKLLNCNIRRFNGKLSDYEKELIEKINNNEYDKLEIGKIYVYGNSSKKIQHFIKV